MKVLPTEAILSRPPAAIDRPTPPTRPQPRPETSFTDLLGKLGGAIERGEHELERARRPSGKLDASDLISLQAGVYRYVEAVDLATKLVDRATSAVKTTLQSQ